ncbi:hypothetical protein GSI_15132 [Ganoderma sinense ZZ0214-1]|uniref:Fungal-type protein kinase domain-containing protein n=1 Tax=Ganoderma sinense ZZ0214-1 TaxID=1077348 RepID=A0A2G8RLP6_9APHY|nr:hypothetical protein GSI_15132 [Ganoderma sinense ZZ0214-1]
MPSGSTGEPVNIGTSHAASQLHDPLGHPPHPNASSHPRREASGDTELGVWASPLAIDEDSSETFGFDSKQAKMRYERALHYSPHQFVGLIPVEEFLETFMDCGRVLREWSDRIPPSADAFTKVPKMANKESQIYEPLIKALNSYIEPESSQARFRCPGFRFLDTSDRPDREHGDVGKLKPDICCYAEPHVELVQSALSEDDKIKNRGATVMGYAALFIEVKRVPGMDPFVDLPASRDRSRWRFVLNFQGVGSAVMQDAMRGCFGQNVTYAAEILARQHRQFLYSILVCGTVARFIRWDRAGALVSSAFDIHRSPEHLCRFLWCFALASDMGRGYDVNVEMAHPHEHELFEAVIRQHLASQLPTKSTPAQLEQALKVHFLQDHVTAIRFPLDNSKEVKRLLVSRPFVYPLAVFGRGTRAYWAVDASAPRDSAHRVVLLKDTWREDPPSNTQTEKEVMQNLRQVGGLDGVPSVLFDGDVIQRDEVVTRYPDQRFYMAVQDLRSENIRIID